MSTQPSYLDDQGLDQLIVCDASNHRLGEGALGDGLGDASGPSGRRRQLDGIRFLDGDRRDRVRGRGVTIIGVRVIVGVGGIVGGTF